MVAGFFCFSAKFLGLYLLQSPVYALVLETLDSVATGLFMAVASMRLTALVPCEALASMRGLLGTVYMGLGKLSGAGVGTAVVQTYGTRASWAIMAAAALTAGTLVAVVSCVVRRPHRDDAVHASDNSLRGVCVQ
ncbi:major facilitator superfamily domain-containing protein 6 [Hyalella azteca]|uniref:Major facilitator superfamily domain-containing protein 6 n=1 Tax=Hyalella azteca TaxID=294128 RepID=A0A8B7N531_HYAAZ|nr:major facilitator superfamily domain-containing protein 6 [Hyalella azteca]